MPLCICPKTDNPPLDQGALCILLSHMCKCRNLAEKFTPQVLVMSAILGDVSSAHSLTWISTNKVWCSMALKVISAGGQSQFPLSPFWQLVPSVLAASWQNLVTCWRYCLYKCDQLNCGQSESGARPVRLTSKWSPPRNQLDHGTYFLYHLDPWWVPLDGVMPPWTGNDFVGRINTEDPSQSWRYCRGRDRLWDNIVNCHFKTYNCSNWVSTGQCGQQSGRIFHFSPLIPEMLECYWGSLGTVNGCWDMCRF